MSVGISGNLPATSMRGIQLNSEIALLGIDKKISSLALGTMTFGDTVDEGLAREMVETAVAAGITMIDTANGYAGGKTEEMLAGILPDFGDDLVLATKAGMPHPDAGENAPLSKQGLRDSLEGSFRRLGRDSVDLFYLHQPDRATPIEETLETLGELLSAGKISAWGVSNFAAWQIAQLQAGAKELGIPGPVVAQQLHNLVARRLEVEYVEFAQTTGLATMVYNPLGGGLLSGKHSFDGAGESAEPGRFSGSRLAEMYRDRYWNEELFGGIGKLSEIAADAGISLVELSLRWLISQPSTTSLLLGGSKLSHLNANLEVIAKGPLEQDILDACDVVGDSLSGPMPAYNR